MGLVKRKPDHNSYKDNNSIISKKVDKKLSYVAQLMSHAAGRNYFDIEEKLFWKRLLFKDFMYMKFLDLKYNFENKFFSISYNFELSTEIEIDESFTEIGDCEFEVVNRWSFQKKHAEWRCIKWENEDVEEKRRYIERLNNKLIVDRINDLDMSRIYVSHKKDSGKWFIICESMIGSATWMLIPPFVNLITPRPEELVKFLEFFQLVSDAIVNNHQ